MILEESGDWFVTAGGADDAAVQDPSREQKLSSADGEVAVSAIAERARSFGHSADHQAVPTGEDLDIPTRADALFANRIQPCTELAESRGRPERGEGRSAWRVDLPQNTVALEVAVLRDSPERAEGRDLVLCRSNLSRGGVEVVAGPDVILSFVTFAVGIERGIETAVRRSHLAAYPLDRIVDDVAHLFVVSRLPEMRSESHEQRVVVEHLLEVRHQPLGVHRIT